MKINRQFGAWVCWLCLLWAASAQAASESQCPPLLQHTFDRLQDEKPQALCQYSGKVLLVVNTASFCGFTGQYQGLEALHAKYKDQGLVVLGFPSNDFSQESGSNRQIAEFCENTFGVKFPMFTKTTVSGAQAVPFFQQLATQTGQKPRWNFYKYLVSREGRALKAYSSLTGPDDKGLVREIERLLAQPTPKG
jgi:glutathione peroxidase